jgi:hypothetical protein
MKNEHGLECPISWDKIPNEHNWIAADFDGITCSFESKPEFDNGCWFTQEVSIWGFNECFNPPADASKCLWKRPKANPNAG